MTLVTRLGLPQSRILTNLFACPVMLSRTHMYTCRSEPTQTKTHPLVHGPLSVHGLLLMPQACLPPPNGHRLAAQAPAPCRHPCLLPPHPPRGHRQPCTVQKGAPYGCARARLGKPACSSLLCACITATHALLRLPAGSVDRPSSRPGVLPARADPCCSQPYPVEHAASQGGSAVCLFASPPHLGNFHPPCPRSKVCMCGCVCMRADGVAQLLERQLTVCLGAAAAAGRSRVPLLRLLLPAGDLPAVHGRT